MKNLLYIFSSIGPVGAPRTRMNSFREIFLERKHFVLDGKECNWRDLVNLPKINIAYVETSTNRAPFLDILRLLFLRFRSKVVVIYVRDVYVEFFSSEYRSVRGRVTSFFNEGSYYFYTVISDFLAFPTMDMGRYFYEQNKFFVKKSFFDLAPGTRQERPRALGPSFNRAIGILYLGGVSYQNSGFSFFIEFIKKKWGEYNFFILSKDKKLPDFISDNGLEGKVCVDFVRRESLLDFIELNNIAFGIHTRPRNGYDDMTYPIKVLDFISMGLPFFTDKHSPLVKTLGEDYPLFCDVTNYKSVSKLLEAFSNSDSYGRLQKLLNEISRANLYEERYEKLVRIASGRSGLVV